MKRTASLFLTLAFAGTLGACSANAVAEPDPDPEPTDVSMPCDRGELVPACTDRLTGVVLDSMDDFDALTTPTPEQAAAYSSLTSASATWAADCRELGGFVSMLPAECLDAAEDIGDAALTINPSFLD